MSCARTFDQFIQFLRALLIQFDAAAMRRDFALQPLRLGAPIGDLGVDLVQSLALIGQLCFALVDLGANLLFRLRQPIDFLLTFSQFVLERLKLLSRMMRVEHAQIGMQRLITSRLSRLALQRSDLPLDLFDDVANAQKVRFGRLPVCATPRAFAFCIW